MSVRNQNIAVAQLRADQLLSESSKLREQSFVAQQSKFVKAKDAEEHEFETRRRRTEFEAGLRHSTGDAEQWIRYAKYELSLNDNRRARSVFERGLAANPSYAPLWLSYARAESRKMKSPTQACSVLRRATKAIPSDHKIWEALILHESAHNGISAAREAYASWLALLPPESAFRKCLEFEAKFKNVPIQRALHVRLVNLWPSSTTYIEWAQFEFQHRKTDNARLILSHAIKLSPNAGLLKSILMFEEQLGCHDRALKLVSKYFMNQGVYGLKFAVSPEEKLELASIFRRLAILSKSPAQISDATKALQIAQTEFDVQQHPESFEAWAKLIRLEIFDLGTLVETLNRAVSSTCPDDDHPKSRWEGYVLVAILSCAYLESSGFLPECRALYGKALQLIPDSVLAEISSELYFSAAQMELRQNNVGAARKLLGQGLGRTVSPEFAARYIEFERQLGDNFRCRMLYAKLLSLDPTNNESWMSFAKFEASLGENERARAVFEAALSVTVELENPENIWLEYADFEADAGEFDRCQSVYRRLLQISHDASHWLAFAMFELSTGASETGIEKTALEAARAIFHEGDTALKAYPSDRTSLADARVSFEIEYGDGESISSAKAAMPTVVTGRYGVDYIFPDTQAKVTSLLERARQWKAKEGKT